MVASAYSTMRSNHNSISQFDILELYMNTELWFLLVLCYRQGFKQYHNFTPEAGEGSWEQSKITRN